MPLFYFCSSSSFYSLWIFKLSEHVRLSSADSIFHAEAAVRESRSAVLCLFFPPGVPLSSASTAQPLWNIKVVKNIRLRPFWSHLYRMQISPASLHPSPSPICTGPAHFCWFSSPSSPLPSKGLCEGLHRRHAKNVGPRLRGNVHVSPTTKWSRSSQQELLRFHASASRILVCMKTNMVKIRRGQNIVRP